MIKERVKTNIPGLDDIINGGLLPKTLNLLTGTTGTGKTILSSQFIYNGLKDFDQSAVYVSFEEPIESMKENCLSLGWDFSPYEKKEKMVYVRYDPFHVEDIYELIETNVKKINAERVIIDSISALGLYVRDTPEIRRMIFNIAFLLRKLNCTTILISEILPMQESLSRFGVEEFVTDSVTVLYYTRIGSQFSRSLTVWKMRNSDHSNKIHPYKITNKGIVVYPKEEAFVK
jgi:KaiC/GvpD/RAD55 family RecA-like ATPase